MLYSHPPLPLPLLFLLPLLQPAHSIPHPDPHPLPHTQPHTDIANCTDPNADFSQSCWATLNLSQTLIEWNPPTCTPADDGADCCDPGEAWSSCFLKLGIGQGYNCTTIGSGSCEFSPALRAGLPDEKRAFVRYVLVNIFYIHTFFTTWYTALNAASGPPATSIITSLIQEVDPERKTHVWLSYLLSALSLGLAFIPALGPEVSTAAQLASKALTSGLQNAPSVARAIWPVGTVNSQQVQIGELSMEVERAAGGLRGMIDAGLGEVMRNKSAFVGFASSGLFSGLEAPSVPNDENVLLGAFKSFLLSRALTANGWYGRVQLDYSGDEYKNACEPSQPAGTVNCVYDDVNKYVISLQNTKHDDKASGLAADIELKGWGNLTTLFEGSLECAGRGGFGGDGAEGGLLGIEQGTGVVDVSCFSQLDCCVSRHGERFVSDPKGACITDYVNGGCPVRNCTDAER